MSNEDNSKLLADFTANEIEEALFSMKPLSAPERDGFSTHFYQKHWPIIGEKVCKYVLSVLNNLWSLDTINGTFISLIPKIKEAKKVRDYRSISLCNVLYKIVAKVLVDRLKPTLSKIISLTQSAFVLGRYITDNILIVYETLHSLSNRCKGHDRFTAIKLDISKSHVRFEWVSWLLLC